MKIEWLSALILQWGRCEDGTGGIPGEFARGRDGIGDAAETGRTAGPRAAQHQPSLTHGTHLR